MKFAALALLALSLGVSAQTYVQPHFRSDGTLVQGHYRSSGGNSGYGGTGSNPSSTYVQPYTTQSGTYVQGHQRTMPDSSTSNNYGASGNYNPYTGAIGARR